MLVPLLALSLGRSGPCLAVRQISAPSPEGHHIAAELATRSPSQRLPTVILISGAGPHTRDYSTDTGNGRNGNEAFRVLRDSLTSRGYAVVRFDERGTGASTGNYIQSATTSSLADDIGSLITALTARSEVDARRLILLGHSEGGAIAWLAASRRPAVVAAISLAGPAWNGQRIMDWQHAFAVEHSAWEQADSTVESRRSRLAERHAERIAKEVWYRYFLSYEPSAAVAQLRIPLLFLHGEEDTQVTAAQASELAQVATDHGNAHATSVVLQDYDHGFRDRGAMGPFPAPVIGTIANWLRSAVPTRTPRGACGAR